MTPDVLRRAVRDGPQAFPVGEAGTLAWFVGAVLWWRLWAVAFASFVALELAYRTMTALDEQWAVLAILGIGFALSEVSDWIAADGEVDGA